MTSAITLVAAEQAEHGLTLPFAAPWFGVIALATFLLLLAFTWAFRNTAVKLVQNNAIKHGVRSPEHGREAGEGTTYGTHH